MRRDSAVRTVTHTWQSVIFWFVIHAVLTTIFAFVVQTILFGAMTFIHENETINNILSLSQLTLTSISLPLVIKSSCISIHIILNNLAHSILTNTYNPFFHFGLIMSLIIGCVGLIDFARLFEFYQMLPFFIFLLIPFVIDGFVLREIRKSQMAGESTFLFHRLKKIFKPLLLLGLLVHLLLPLHLGSFYWLSLALISGICITKIIANYKKYV